MAVPSAFLPIFEEPKFSKIPGFRRRRPIWVLKDKGKEFIKSYSLANLRREDIHVQVWKNPYVKCGIVEQANRMIRDRLYKYFTYKYRYRYFDALPKFVTD